MSRGDSGPKPVGCIYSLHPGCHPLEDIGLRLPSIGFPITETLFTGFSFVASRSRVPRRTTCLPPLWLRRLLAHSTFYNIGLPT